MIRTEVSYAIDVDQLTARELGRDLHRNYPPTSAREIVGTNDIEAMGVHGWPIITDIKTGVRLGPVAENPQILFLCLAKRLVTGATKVEGRLHYIAEDGGGDPDVHVFDALTLDAFGDRLAEMLDRVETAKAAGGVPDVVAGDWCRYCPAIHACPAHVALARAMDPTLTGLAARIATMTPEEQGIAWQQAKQIEHLLGLVQDGLKRVALERDIPLPNGQVVKGVSYPRRNFVGSRALAMLEERGLEDEARASLYSTVEVTSAKVCGKPKARVEASALAPPKRTRKAKTTTSPLTVAEEDALTRDASRMTDITEELLLVTSPTSMNSSDDAWNEPGRM